MNKFILLAALQTLACVAFAQQPATYSAHYYDRIALFAEEPPIKHNDIVMVGNSLTENGGDWGARLQKKHVRNRGIIGDEAQGIYDRLSEITSAKPSKIVLMVGINDVSHDLSADSIVTLISGIIEKISADTPRTRIYLQSILPVNESFGRYKKLTGKTGLIPVINRKLEQLAGKHKRVRFVDLFPLFTEPEGLSLDAGLSTDGLHLNEKGYSIWEKALRKQL